MSFKLLISITIIICLIINISCYHLNSGSLRLTSNLKFVIKSNSNNNNNNNNNNNVHTISYNNHHQTSYKSNRKQRKSYLSMTSTLNNPNKVIADALLPQHELLVQGKLDNGFSYIILPNAVPPGRFEAHLEVLSGSAHELESQVSYLCNIYYMYCMNSIFSHILLHTNSS